MKKRLLKSVAALALGAVLLLGSSLSALANPALPPDKGTLTIHKYLMEDLSEANAPNNGHEAGTNGNPAVPGSAVPLEDINFDVYEIQKSASGDYPGAAPYRLSGTTLTDAAGDTFTVVFKETLTTGDGTGGTTLGVVTSSQLDQGVYLVIEQPDARVTTPCDPFVVAVPMTNPTGDGWIENVHVYPKNESSDAKKEIIGGGESVSIGDILTYRLTVTVPTTGIWTDDLTEDAIIKYEVFDMLDPALDFLNSTVQIEGLQSGETAGSGTLPSSSFVLGTHYTINASASLVIGGTTYTGPFSIDFTAAGRKLLFDNDIKSLSITFDAEVNDGLLLNEHREVDNEATVEFTNKFGDKQQVTSNKVTSHTGIIDLLKVDATDTTTVLSGAEFAIALTEADALAGDYLKKDSNGNIVGPTDPGYAGLPDWREISDGSGSFRFEGLQDFITTYNPDGTVAGTTYLSYWLVETKAPAGYNLLDAPIEVEFTASNSIKHPDSDEDLSYVLYEVEVPNTNDFTLPKTGGMGTILFTVAGILLIGTAVILIASGRRKKEKL